tara:strand:- start:1102 stop:1800 length:699 start_codon:yes stop_codon:yes gene_type:complete
MNKIFEFETYLSISQTKFGIYLFDTKNRNNLYDKEINFEKTNFINYSDLKKFLDDNIFRIEKLLGKFVENIFIIIDYPSILNIQIGIKQKNYEPSKSKTYLQSSITNAKDLFKENYPDEKIIHIIIKNYMIDGKNYSYLQDNLKCEQLNLEIQFKSISNEIIYSLNKVLKNYQINITKYADGDYVKNFFNNDLEISKMTFDILNGCNENEVMVIQKNTKKSGFFEKFFNLFG